MQTQLLVLGRLARPYGIKGWLHMHSFDRELEFFLDLKTCFIGSAELGWQDFAINGLKIHGKNLIIHLAGIHDPNAAGLLTNKYFALPEAQLGVLEANTYYWAQLEGLEVFDLEAKYLGKVDYLFRSAAHDNLVLNLDGRTYHIPFILDRYVKTVDLLNAKIIVDWELI